MKRLVVVAGPPASGKSWVIEHLRDGHLSDLRAALVLGKIDEWEITDALRLSKGKHPLSAKAMMHYDFWRVVSANTGRASFSEDRVLDWLGHCEQVTIVTCMVNSDVLGKRLRRRIPRFIVSKLGAALQGRAPSLYSPLRQIELLGQATKLARLYQNWFSFCQQAGIAHQWQLDTTDTPSLAPITDDMDRPGH